MMKQIVLAHVPLAFASLVAFANPSVLYAQCVTTPAACTEFVRVGSGPARILVYRSHPLDTPNDSITRALIMVHGADRTIRWEFRSAIAGAFLAGSLQSTLIIAPRFAANDGTNCADSLSANELNWECDLQRVDWRLGGVARNDSVASAFNAMDALVLALARGSTFPNLRRIVVAGHSAGGQFVTLYAMANHVHDSLKVELSYVVANSASYAYLDDRRPPEAWLAASGRIDPSDTTRINFTQHTGASSCPGYGNWPFGLAKKPPYAARLSDAQLVRQAAQRPVTYLLSVLDVSPAPPGGYYGSCAAMAQGSNRLSRGLAFASYMAQVHRAPHRSIVVDGCGHDTRCVYTSDQSRRVLFPR